MKRIFAISTCGLALALGTPAVAQEKESAKSVETAIDPARLDAARHTRHTVDYLFPIGN